MSNFNLYDLMLIATAGHYDLSTEAGRKRSNEDLVKFFMAINFRLKPEVTYEIGAYDPRFSVEIKKRMPDTRAFALEASPYNYERCRTNDGIEEFGVEYLHYAVSDKTGEAEFYVQRKVQGEIVNTVRGNNSLLLRTEENIEYEKHIVSTVTLDDFARQKQVQDKKFTTWIDVEGAARGVLLGAKDLWLNCEALMIEVEQYAYWHDQWLFWDIAGYLMKRGFVPVARDFEYEYQFNVVFIKQPLLENPSIREGLVKYHSLLYQRSRK